jgi:hypothetical protein
MAQQQSGIDPQRRAGLHQAKLAALIRSRWVTTDLVVPDGVGAPGPALVDDAVTARQGWVLVDPTTQGALGGALTWGLRHGVADLALIVDDQVLDTGDPSAAVLARRAGLFRNAAKVWEIDGREVRKATAAPPAGPATAGGPSTAGGPATSGGPSTSGGPAGAGGAAGAGGPIGAGGPAEVDGLADLMRAHGVDPVMEHGVLLGEVLGLEVARSVSGPEGLRLEVGVGHHDREARAEMRPGQSVAEALDEVVAVVRRWRAPDAERHPANLLARERWLRSLVMGRPALVGARWLDPVAPIFPRGDLRRAVPAVAAGVGTDGRTVIAVCSTGVDLDLVPVAADHRHLAGDAPRLVLVMPRGDDVRATRDLVDALVDPAEIVTVDRDWPAVLTG